MVYIIQNDPDVPPGNIVDHLGVPHTVCHPYKDGSLPGLDQVSALIVLGGAMGANDDRRHPFLTELKRFIRTVVEAQIPYLGICLGGQLLAAALGAEVASGRWEEIGSATVSLTKEGARDPLFLGIKQSFRTFQWHHDSFDLPAGGTLLATSGACHHQAFRVGKNAWGLQFHPEVTESIIRCWSAWDSTTPARTEEYLTEFRKEAGDYYSVSRQMVGNLLRQDIS